HSGRRGRAARGHRVARRSRDRPRPPLLPGRDQRGASERLSGRAGGGMELADWTRELPALRAIAIAAALAALLGWERERARKPAGLRTHILVGAGSALLIILGDTALQRFEEQQGAEMVESDPIRVVQAVI